MNTPEGRTWLPFQLQSLLFIIKEEQHVGKTVT